MTIIELTPFHLAALGHFLSRRLTDKGLARAMKCELAVARYAIQTLKSAELIEADGAYQFVITQDGILKLRGEPDDLRQMQKPPADPVKELVKRMSVDESKEISATLDAKEPESIPDPNPAANDHETHHLLEESKSHYREAQPSFEDLLYRGLERLNKQLKYSPVAINNKRHKVAMLTSLADTLDGFDRNISASLREVATDINKLPEVGHGLHN